MLGGIVIVVCLITMAMGATAEAQQTRPSIEGPSSAAGPTEKDKADALLRRLRVIKAGQELELSRVFCASGQQAEMLKSSELLSAQTLWGSVYLT